MILTCPRCATQYLVEDTEVRSDGRKVRCSACGEEWRAFPDRAVAQSPRLAGETLEPVEPSVDIPVAASAEVSPPAATPTPAELEEVGEPAEPPVQARDDVDPVPAASAEPPEPPPPDWTQPPPAAPAEAEASMVAPISMSRPAAPRSSGGAWALTILIALAVMVGVLLSARNEIVEAVPAARGVYQALGLPILAPG